MSVYIYVCRVSFLFYFFMYVCMRCQVLFSLFDVISFRLVSVCLSPLVICFLMAVFMFVALSFFSYLFLSFFRYLCISLVLYWFHGSLWVRSFFMSGCCYFVKWSFFKSFFVYVCPSVRLCVWFVKCSFFIHGLLSLVN